MNIMIVGNGAMGQAVKAAAEAKEGVDCRACIEPLKGEGLGKIVGKVDVVIDFSHPENLDMIEEYGRKKGCGVVLATTGYSEKQQFQIKELSEQIPVVQSSNFSMGIAVVREVLRGISPLLKDDFDIEVVEKHHNRKIDSPSGTANLLVSAIDPKGEFKKVFGRFGFEKRSREIGMHSVRGGTIAGEHSIIFAGEDEIIELKHTALSKKIFAQGALKAAEFLHYKIEECKAVNEAATGLYGISDVMKLG